MAYSVDESNILLSISVTLKTFFINSDSDLAESSRRSTIPLKAMVSSPSSSFRFTGTRMAKSPWVTFSMDCVNCLTGSTKSRIIQYMNTRTKTIIPAWNIKNLYSRDFNVLSSSLLVCWMEPFKSCSRVTITRCQSRDFKEAVTRI